MSRNRVVLAAVGGVAALAVLAMCAVLWFAFAAKTAAQEGDFDEGTQGLETVVNEARRLSTGKVYPGPDGVKAIKADIDRVADWRREAIRLAARGDRVFEKTTPAALKSFIVRDAKRIAALPGAVDGALVNPEFAFGPFKPYIAEGKMPEDARLAELQRRWDDLSGFAETLSSNGVAELVSFDFRDTAPDAEKDKATNAAQQNRNRRGGARQPEAKSDFKPSSFSYVAVFRARPNALIRVVNAIDSGERFIVVDSLSFERGSDALLAALGGEDKSKASPQQQFGRRRRRRGGEEPAKPAESAAGGSTAKDGIVTDPSLDAPFDVTLAFTVYDCNSLAEEPSAEGKEKGAAK